MVAATGLRNNQGSQIVSTDAFQSRLFWIYAINCQQPVGLRRSVTREQVFAFLDEAKERELFPTYRI